MMEEKQRGKKKTKYDPLLTRLRFNQSQINSFLNASSIEPEEAPNEATEMLPQGLTAEL